MGKVGRSCRARGSATSSGARFLGSCLHSCSETGQPGPGLRENGAGWTVKAPPPRPLQLILGKGPAAFLDAAGAFA